MLELQSILDRRNVILVVGLFAKFCYFPELQCRSVASKNDYNSYKY